MKVALNCLSGATPTNGARVYLIKLAQALANISGLEIVLVVGRGDTQSLPGELREMALELDVPPARSYRQIGQSRTISAALRRANIDLLHLPNTLPPPWTKAPTVVTIFDMAELRVRRYGKIRTAYRWLINLASAHTSKAVITISENSKSDIARYLRIDRDKITVTYLGVGEEFCPGSQQQARAITRQRLGLDRFFLVPGGIAANKNIEGAIKAFAQFRHHGGTDSLVITGAGAPGYAHSLRALCRDHGVDGQIVWTGCVQRGELPTFYRAAVATVYPSFYEGFGLPILEAMASGCPVIASNTSSIPEVAGNAAMLVDPHDTPGMTAAMESLAVNESIRQSLVERGLNRAAAFSWAGTALETHRVYESVMRANTRAAHRSGA